MRTLRTAIFASLLFWATPVAAQRAPVPASEWNDNVRHTLARALVAEVGWDSELEWASVSFILARRARQGGMSFERMTRRYCSIYKIARRHPERLTHRQRWVLALPWGELAADPGMPANIDWRRYAARWRTVRAFVWKLELGMVNDPTPRAMFFSSRADLATLPYEVQRRIDLLPSTIVHPETGEVVRLRNRVYRMRPDRGPDDGSGTAPSGAILDARDAV